ncbi:MAG: threonine-phosphate decarboxylase CobD [Alphaproteobacteria bacterium]
MRHRMLTKMDTTDPSPLPHGGDIADAEARFGVPAAGWLDLSTGINPDSYPGLDVMAETWQRLPQSGAMNGLLAAARRYYRVPDGVALVAAAGSQAVLQSLPGIAAAGRIAIVGPTYAEHERVWRERGYEIRNVASIAASGAADIVVVVNPNNPDGRTARPTELLALAAAITAWRGLLIVDEAFADVAPESSVLPHLSEAHRVVVLRSFGKFFGLAGLRLGFAAGPPELIEPLARRLGPWAVSGPAQEIGARALTDDGWIAGARKRLAERRAALDAVLAAANLHVTGGTDLFRLVDDARAPEICRRLGASGILIRNFDHNPNWLRFGVPGRAGDLKRLEAALAGLR